MRTMSGLRIGCVVIVGFNDKRTEAFCQGRPFAAFSVFVRTASRRLDQLDAGIGLRDPAQPDNRPEARRGGRRGQSSIRIIAQ